jgi:hypothetical protein
MSTNHARNRKIAVSAVVAGLVLAGGGAAFAYWSSSGSGVGEATTGESTAFTVTSEDATGGPLTPGGPSQSVTFTVTNPSTGAQTLNSVVVRVANADGSAWTAVAGCSAADYAITTPVVAYGVIAGGADVDGTVSISMINATTNQDACQLADVPLHIAAS